MNPNKITPKSKCHSRASFYCQPEQPKCCIPVLPDQTYSWWKRTPSMVFLTAYQNDDLNESNTETKQLHYNINEIQKGLYEQDQVIMGKSQSEATSQNNKSTNKDNDKKSKLKRDQRKNVYGNSFKFILKAFFSEQYQTLFTKLCTKYQTTEDQVKEFYKERKHWEISLKDVRNLLNFKEHQEGPQRRVKECFHAFYVWFLRNRYSIHILTCDKIQNKQAYFQAKNYLVFLPDIQVKGLNRQNYID